VRYKLITYLLTDVTVTCGRSRVTLVCWSTVALNDSVQSMFLLLTNGQSYWSHLSQLASVCYLVFCQMNLLPFLLFSHIIDRTVR